MKKKVAIVGAGSLPSSLELAKSLPTPPIIAPAELLEIDGKKYKARYADNRVKLKLFNMMRRKDATQANVVIEFALIQGKNSTLSRRHRDWVVEAFNLLFEEVKP